MILKFDLYLHIFLINIAVLHATYELKEDANYWHQLSHNSLLDALETKNNKGVAKNVILFVGSGLGPTTTTAARIYGKTEKGHLSFENFPNLGCLKTYNSDNYVPDSSSSKTALFCGAKGNTGTGGVDATVKHGDCAASLKECAQVDSIIDWAQGVGKATGFVTNTRVTGSISPLYAHYADNSWECDSTLPPEAAGCKDIARQLIEDEPGRNIKVIMGGGRQALQSNAQCNKSDPINQLSCYSKDGRNLIEDWKQDKANRSCSYQVLSNNKDLNELDLNTEYVLGIFANGNLKMNWHRDDGPKGMPSLTNMTEAAIKLLQKEKHGFLLVVEGGLINEGHTNGHARQALDEAVEFSRAVNKAVKLTSAHSCETLIIVTADHAHSLVFSGYMKRGKNILDVAQKSKVNKVPYTALLYGTGPTENFQFYAMSDEVIRHDPSTDDTHDFQYSQQAVILTDEVTNSGTDVYVYSTGPMAHLFQTVHEQTYVPYVIAYAARMGPYEKYKYPKSSASTNSYSLGMVFISTLILFYIGY